MSKLKIEKGASKVRRSPLKATIDGAVADDLELMCEWSENDSSYTLAADNEVSISTDPAVPGFVPTLGFLNNDGFNGFGLASSDLASYELLTTEGPISAPPNVLAPTVGFPATDGFALDGGAETLVLTSDDTLTFTAVVTPPVSPVPEPGSLMLVGTGLLGAAGTLRRRLQRS